MVLLQERIVNAHSPEEKLAWVDRIAPLVLASYAYIGGFKGQTTPEGLKAALEREAHDDSYWKISVRSGQPVAVRSYKHTPYGLKANLMATDRSPTGKKDFVSMAKADVTHRDVHGEVSGKAEPFLLGIGYEPAMRDTVKKIFKDMETDEEGRYERIISGRRLKKRLVGTPKFHQRMATS